MDPDALIQQLLKLSNEQLELEKRGHAEEIARLVIALNRWLVDGGRLPWIWTEAGGWRR